MYCHTVVVSLMYYIVLCEPSDIYAVLFFPPYCVHHHGCATDWIGAWLIANLLLLLQFILAYPIRVMLPFLFTFSKYAHTRFAHFTVQVHTDTLVHSTAHILVHSICRLDDLMVWSRHTRTHSDVHISVCIVRVLGYVRCIRSPHWPVYYLIGIYTKNRVLQFLFRR